MKMVKTGQSTLRMYSLFILEKLRHIMKYKH